MTTSVRQIDDFEGSAWLRNACQQRINAMGRDPAVMAFVAQHSEAEPGLIVSGLRGGVPRPGSRADRTCDRCGAFVAPDRAGFRVFAMTFAMPGARVQIGIGLCARCAAREGLPRHCSTASS